MATTVHERQVVDEPVDPEAHDVPMDLIVTPERTIRTGGGLSKLAGIDRDALDPERIEEIPVLSRYLG